MKRGITRREREVTDINEIIGILDRAKIVHVGMVDEGKPYIVPMNYGYPLEDGRLTFYLHSAVKGDKLELRHPIRTIIKKEKTAGREYDVVWRGPDVIEILPYGEHLRTVAEGKIIYDSYES